MILQNAEHLDRLNQLEDRRAPDDQRRGARIVEAEYVDHPDEAAKTG